MHLGERFLGTACSTSFSDSTDSFRRLKNSPSKVKDRTKVLFLGTTLGKNPYEIGVSPIKMSILSYRHIIKKD
jgi:hypothetical protein